MIKSLFIILLIFISNYSFADEPRYHTSFKSENNKYLLDYHSKSKSWKLKDQDLKTYYSINDKKYTSMTALVSNDGQKIIFIDDFREGHQEQKRPALYFYIEGKLVKSYKLTQLITDQNNAVYSICHTLWALEDFGFENSDSIFSLATFEFNEIRFNTFTGEIVSNNKPDKFDDSTLIVYGKFSIVDSERCTMSIMKYIHGEKQENDTITFKHKRFGEGTWYRTLMIKDGKDITPDRYLSGIIF